MKLYSELLCEILLLGLSILVRGEDNRWENKVPSNKLGIFVNTMVRVEWKYHHGIEMWNYNRDYMDQETEDVIQIMCDESLKEDSKIGTWTNCTTNSHTLTAAHLTDTLQDWDKNVTYHEVVIKPFKNSNGEVCIFNEKPRKLFYLSAVSILFRTSLEEDEEPIIKLEKFFPFALYIFKDLIDTKLIYQYEGMDFMTRPKGYSCLLSLVEKDSVESIKKHCSFDCKSKSKTATSFRNEL